MSSPVEFESSYFLRVLKGDFHPFTPNIIVVDHDSIEYKRRNWHMISSDTENLNFRNITGITIDNHIFGSTIKIKSSGNDPIFVHGFWKSEAERIKELCSKKTRETTSHSFSNPTPSSNNNLRIADELKKLKELIDQGVINQEEFDSLKRKLMNS